MCISSIDCTRIMCYIIITARDKRAATGGPGESRGTSLKSLESRKGAGRLRQVDREKAGCTLYNLPAPADHKEEMI